MSDAFAQFHFNNPGISGLWQSFIGLFGAPGATSFTHLCPGGMAPKGATILLQGTCKAALITGTQQAILVTCGFYAWGAAHYFLGSIGLAKQMGAAAKANGG